MSAVAFSFIRPEARVDVQLLGAVGGLTTAVTVKPDGITIIADPILFDDGVVVGSLVIVIANDMPVCPAVAVVGNMVAVKINPSVNVVIAMHVPSVASTAYVPTSNILPVSA